MTQYKLDRINWLAIPEGEKVQAAMLRGIMMTSSKKQTI